MLMKYLTLEGRYSVCYYYHFPLLNHFFHCDFISFTLFLLHNLVDSVMDVIEKMKKVVNYTILHQGLMFRLYRFHLALVPPRIVEIDIPSQPNPCPQYVPIRIMDPRAPTPQPFPSGSHFESKPTPLGKKGKSDKGKEKEPEESKDEGRGGRRLGRIVKSNAKRKLRSGASQEEELDSEEMGHPKWWIKEKALNSSEGNMEEEEVEVFDSSRSISKEGIKGRKQMSHVLATIRLGCVDLTKD
jgi:hypothetical protein